MAKRKLTAFELESILRAQDCTCVDRKPPRGWGCTRRVIRCPERLKWMRNNDETFRRVWQIDTEPGKS